MISDVKFIQCGTGTSAGIPIIGCACDVCRSSDPRDRRTRCGACLRFKDEAGTERVVLIDVPPDHRAHSLALGLTRCDLILLTHDHVDHVFGLDEVRRYNALMKQSIDVHAEPATLVSIERMFQHIFKKEENINDSFVADLVSCPIVVGEPIDRFGVRFEPLRLVHGNLDIVGFRIEALGDEQPDPFPLGYLTDCSAIPAETWPRLSGLKTVVLDMLRYRAHPTHLTTDQAVDFAQTIGAEKTWFIHMTHDIGHASFDKTLPPRMALAYDGLQM